MHALAHGEVAPLDRLHGNELRCAAVDDQARVIAEKEHRGDGARELRFARRNNARVLGPEERLAAVQAHAVHGADEVGNERAARLVVDRLRRADLHDLSCLHHGDPIAQGHRFCLVVRHVHRRDRERAQQPVDVDAQLLAQLRIKGRERLIEQQDARPHRERASERHALALAAGKLVDPPIAEALELDEREELVDLLRRQLAADTQTIADVLGDAHVREERVALKHHADIAPLDRQRGHILGAEKYAAARIGRFKPGDDAKERRLAAARRPEQDQRFALGDLEIQGLQRARAVRKGLCHLPEPDMHPLAVHCSAFGHSMLVWAK